MHKSYRYLYEAVKKIPSDLEKILRKITAANQQKICELLLDKPKESIVGEYYRADRKVHLGKMQIWELENKFCLVDAVPHISIISVVVGLNALLRKNNLSYSIWSECRVGNPKNAPNCTGKRLYREKADFKIGLVNKSKPRSKNKKPKV